MIHRGIILAVFAAFLAVTVTSMSGTESLAAQFISNGMAINILRIALMVVLAGLFFIRPPRPMAFRVLIGVIGVVMVGASWYGVASYSLSVIDALLLFQTALIFGTEALENGLSAQRISRASNNV